MLDRKLWRDIWHMRTQAVAIALVIGAGVCTYIISHSTIDSLQLTQRSFYASSNFADVFATLKRAPELVAGRLREIPGVSRTDTRVVAPVTLDIADFADPVSGILMSLPDGDGALNRIYIKRGRLPGPDEDNAVVINDAFAEAHRLKPGDRLRITVNGRQRDFVISGIGLSAEFVYLIRPGDFFPDYAHYGLLWMNRRPLAAAYGMDGAFNSVLLSITPGSPVADVIDSADRILGSWGGTGAIGRADQISHRYLTEEVKQLNAQATIVPAIFLGVAAFLINVVIARTVRQQRDQIAILKAFGFSTTEVTIHYLKLVSLIVLLGALIGVPAGGWLAHGLSRIYAEFFRYPYLQYRLLPGTAFTGVAISAAAALLGAAGSVWRAAAQPPAQAMHPEAPPRYRETLVEKTGLKQWLSQPARMYLRNVARRPLKSLLTVLGISFAAAILTAGGFQEDAINYMLDMQFNRMHRADLTVSFTDPLSSRSLQALRQLPGVLDAEGLRSVPTRLRHGYRSERVAIQGYPPDSRLNRLLDTRLRPIRLPDAGVVLNEHLARKLDAVPGTRLTVDLLEGRRRSVSLPVAAVVQEYTGTNAYMDLDALSRLLGENRNLSGAFLDIEPGATQALYAQLKETPRVAGTMIRAVAIRGFQETMGENLLIFAAVNLSMAGVIAFGVVYNSTRIALAERAHELATLRVLGMTRGEIAYVLLGEMGLLTLLAIPLGCAIGYGLCALIAHALASDLYRVPVILEPATYAFAATMVLLAAALSSLAVYLRLGRLDLIAVLKTRE